jgi:hypothetical protein
MFEVINNTVAVKEEQFKYVVDKDMREESFFFNIGSRSELPEIEEAFQIIKETLPRRRNRLSRIKTDMALKCLLCNIVRGLKDMEVIGISRRTGNYKLNEKYTADYAFYTYNIMTPLFDNLIKAGWIYQKKGIYDQKNKTEGTNGLCSKIWATERLLELLEDLSLKYLEEAKEKRPLLIYEEVPELVVLSYKDEDKNRISVAYKDDKFSKELRKELKYYNEFLKSHCIEAEVDNSLYSIIQEVKNKAMSIRGIIPFSTNDDSKDTALRSLLDGRLHCCFNRADVLMERWKNGGRYYTGSNGYQNLPQEIRSTITIDGKPTVELDYKSLHINMLYAKAGIQNEKDPYQIANSNSSLRKGLKSLLLISINAKDFNSTQKAYRKEIRELAKKDYGKLTESQKKKLHSMRLVEPKIKEWLERFQKEHEAIKDRLCSDAGIKLMNKDAKIMRIILNHFYSKDIVVLPVHDSVIIAEEHETELREVMDNAYRKIMDGFSCGIEKKTAAKKTTEIIQKETTDEMWYCPVCNEERISRYQINCMCSGEPVKFVKAEMSE